MTSARWPQTIVPSYTVGPIQDQSRARVMVPSWDMIAANLMAMQSPAFSGELQILLGSGSSFRFLLRGHAHNVAGF